MYTILLCHRRAKEVSYQAFHNHWFKQRRHLVLELKAQLGYTQYTQIHQLPRYNLLYQGIELTRSQWVTQFFAPKTSNCVRSPASDRTIGKTENWDVVERLSYSSYDALVEALTSLSAKNGTHRLKEDAAPYLHHSTAIATEEFAIAQNPNLNFPRIVNLFCLQSKADITRAQMLAYWGNNHKALVVSLQSALKYHTYEQLHVRSSKVLTDILEIFGGRVNEEFDGVASLGYTNQKELVWGFLNPKTQIANLRLVKDETSFINHQRSVLVFGREYQFYPQ